jgi:hypothetical protein
MDGDAFRLAKRIVRDESEVARVGKSFECGSRVVTLVKELFDGSWRDNRGLDFGGMIAGDGYVAKGVGSRDTKGTIAKRSVGVAICVIRVRQG